MFGILLSVIIDTVTGTCARAAFTFGATAATRSFDIKVKVPCWIWIVVISEIR